MVISATIDKIIKDPDATVVEVTYTDGVSFKAQKEYRLTSFNLENFKSIVRSQIDAFGQTDNVDKVLITGPFDPTAAVVQPTSLQLFSQEVSKFYSMQKAVELGLMQSTDKAYTDLQTQLKTDFVFPDYLVVL